jgi:hypothetical protein
MRIQPCASCAVSQPSRSAAWRGLRGAGRVVGEEHVEVGPTAVLPTWCITTPSPASHAPSARCSLASAVDIASIPASVSESLSGLRCRWRRDCRVYRDCRCSGGQDMMPGARQRHCSRGGGSGGSRSSSSQSRAGRPSAPSHRPGQPEVAAAAPAARSDSASPTGSGARAAGPARAANLKGGCPCPAAHCQSSPRRRQGLQGRLLNPKCSSSVSSLKPLPLSAPRSMIAQSSLK